MCRVGNIFTLVWLFYDVPVGTSGTDNKIPSLKAFSIPEV